MMYLSLQQKHYGKDNKWNMLAKENVDVGNRSNHNNVYRYFSNSKDKSVAMNAMESEQADMQMCTSGDNNHHMDAKDRGLKVNNAEEQFQAFNVEKKCFHLYEKICPNCNGPLKRMEDCYCLRCEKTIYYDYPGANDDNKRINKTDVIVNNQEEGKSNNAASTSEPRECNNTESNLSISGSNVLQEFYICKKCERLYTFCSRCFQSTAECVSCRNNLNVCSYCRRKLCVFCLQEVATGLDTEKQHISEFQDEMPKVNYSHLLY